MLSELLSCPLLAFSAERARFDRQPKHQTVPPLERSISLRLEFGHGQFSRTPPSMINSVPVMLLESSDSRNLAARATSSDVPNRRATWRQSFPQTLSAGQQGSRLSLLSACQSVRGSTHSPARRAGLTRLLRSCRGK